MIALKLDDYVVIRRLIFLVERRKAAHANFFWGTGIHNGEVFMIKNNSNENSEAVMKQMEELFRLSGLLNRTVSSFWV